MDLNIYLRKVEEKFNNSSKSLSEISIDGQKVITVQHLFQWNILDGMRAYYFIIVNRSNNKMNLESVYNFIISTRRYTNQFFREPSFTRFVGAMTYPIFISKGGFTNTTIEFVKTSKLFKWGDDCIPLLVDIKNSELTSLEKFGFFARFPIKKNTKKLIKDFNLF